MSELLVELKINEDNDNGVSTISFVENPAIQEDFMYFSNEEIIKLQDVDNEMRIVTGLAMIPNKKILRRTADGKDYFVFFSNETVKRSSELFLMRSNHKGTTVNHDKFIPDGVTVVESWIVDNPKLDKSIHLGFKDVPQGSWMVSYKVDNDELWNDIKNKKVLGFSIEGTYKPVEFKSDEALEMECIEILDSCMSDEEIVSAIKKKLEL
jgi:hypothetical protein|tara:strand:- start:1105 stop:1731 length:627 start_codon:yes stop_codon:yes gene_type:complete